MANILIADPEERIRKIITDSLHSDPHQFYFADTETQMIDVLKREPIQVVIAEKDVFEREITWVIPEMKRLQKQAAVVVMHSLGEENEEWIDAGAFANLTKPFPIKEVQRIVHEAVPRDLQNLSQYGRKKHTWFHKVPKRAWIGAGVFLGAFFLFVAALMVKRALVTPPVRFFAVPYAHVSGIAFNEKEIWVSDWYDQNFYRHEADAILSLRQTTHQDNYHPSAIAFKDGILWSASAWDKKIVRHRPDVGLSVDRAFALPAPIAKPSALYWEGDTLWACDLESDKIYQLTLEGNDLKIFHSVQAPGPKPIGVFKIKKDLWSADSRTGLLYKHLPDAELTVAESYALPADLQKETLSSFSGEGENFWLSSEAGRKIYVIRKEHLTLIARKK